MGVFRLGSRQLSRELLKAHKTWLRAGRKGPGQLALKGEKLSGLVAEAENLEGAEFVGCEMFGARIESAALNDARFRTCDLGESLGLRTRFVGATFGACKFTSAEMPLSVWDGATVIECSFVGFLGMRTRWKQARVEDCNFYEAQLDDAIFEMTRFVSCDFRRANVSKAEGGDPLGISRGAIFDGCDFRHADLSERVFQDATLVNCKFFGVTGTPVISGSLMVADADFSEAADGSEMLNETELRQRWGTSVH